MLTARSIPLFIHLLGVVTLFLALGIMQRAGAAIRAASTIEELRLWAGLARTTGPMFPASFLFILASGLYMTSRSWTFKAPWVVVAIVSVVVMVVLGGGVVDRGIGAMGRAATASGSLTADLARLVARPTPWVTLTALNGMAIGLLWLMVNKPGWTQSLTVMVALGALGTMVGAAMLRRGQRASR